MVSEAFAQPLFKGGGRRPGEWSLGLETADRVCCLPGGVSMIEQD